jgi:hypothetical protein
MAVKMKPGETYKFNNGDTVTVVGFFRYYGQADDPQGNYGVLADTASKVRSGPHSWAITLGQWDLLEPVLVEAANKPARRSMAGKK